MSAFPSSASSSSTAPSKGNRGSLIAGVVALGLVCICVVVVGALVGGSFVFKLGPFAQSGSNWPVVLSDNFASNANGWNLSSTQPFVTDSGTYSESLAAGKYSVDAKALKGINELRWPRIPAVSDLSVTVDARQVGGPQTADYGLVFRRDENGNAYVFVIREDKQFSVWVGYQGQWTALIIWTKTDAIRPGQVNHLNVTGVGSHFTFSINNQQVGAVDNSQVSSGVAGVNWEMESAGEAVFEFSNFELRAPTGSAQAAPTGQTTLATATEQTALATPTSSAQWPVVLSDNFASNASGWNLTSPQPDVSDYGTFSESLAAGKYSVDAKALKSVNIKRWPKIPAVSDLSVTVDARQVSGPQTADYGLMFRKDENGNFYLFGIREDKQFAVYLYQGQWATLIDWTKTDAILPGQVNHLNVTAAGSHFTFSINNQQVGAADNSQLSNGAAGLYFEMQAAGDAVFEFSNFELRAPAGSAQATPTEQTTLATPTSSAQWPVVLSDNFASNANGWNLSSTQPSVSDYGTLSESLAAGKYRGDFKALKPVITEHWPKIPAVSDLSMTVDARQVSGPQAADYGLMFRRDEKGNFYLFGIREDKQFAVYLYQGQWATLMDWTKTDAIQPGQVNHLNVTALGSHLTFSINNQQVAAIDNSQLSSGAAGFYFEMQAAGEAVFEFSNFELRAPAGSAQATPTGQTTLATPTSSAQLPVVLSDNFASNANAWNISDKQPYTSDFGTINESIGGGRLHLEAKMVKNVDEKYWPKNLQAVSDLSLTVEGKRVSGPESSVQYGLFFRRDDNDNFYLFEVRDDRQFSVSVSYQGKWTTLIDWTKTDAIQPGQVNRLNVTAVGSHFTFSINNQQVGEVDNGQIKSGTAGLAFDMDGNTEAVFEFSFFELRAP